MKKSIIILFIIGLSTVFCQAQNAVSGKKNVDVQKDTLNVDLLKNNKSQGVLLSNKKQVANSNTSGEVKPIEKKEENKNAVSTKKDE